MQPTPDELLAHAEWLRRLAASLVGPGAADDVVQDTYVAALGHPPPAGRLRAWLAHVLKNIVRMRFRREAVRARGANTVADLAKKDEEISHERLLDRFETQRTLVRIVSELPEPYRSTVLLRYFEGLNAREISRVHGVAPGTVRWRLKEALDRVRAELDHAHNGDRRRWAFALLPLARPSAGVGKGVAAAAVLLAVTAVVVWVVRRPSAPPPPTTVAHGAPAARAPATPPAPAIATEAAPAAEPPRVPMAAAVAAVDPDTSAGLLAGRIVNWATGRGVPGAQVTFAAPEGTVAATTDGEGRFRFEAPRPGRYDLQVVTAPDFLPYAPSLGHSPITFVARPGLRVDSVRIYLTPAIDYDGVVVDPAGKPVAGARVVLLDATQGEQTLHPIAAEFTTDERGEFVFHAPDGALFEARHPGYVPGRARVDHRVQVSHRMELRLGRGEPDRRLGRQRIAGRVVDETGAGVPDVLLVADPTDLQDLRPGAQAETDEHGAFVLVGLDPGAYDVLARPPAAAPVRADAVAAGVDDLVITLPAGGSVAGRVVDDATGRPVPAFSLTLLRPEGPLRDTTAADVTFMDAEGRFAVSGLEEGPLRAMARAPGYAPSALVSTEVGAQDVVLRLGRGGTVVGRVIDRETGAPLTYARVTVEGGRGEGTSASPAAQSTVTEGDGTFALSGIASGSRSLVVAAYQHHGRILGGLSFAEGATVGPITIDLAPTAPGEEPKLELAGIGTQLEGEGDALVVRGVFPGGGAAEAGLQAGDGILAVDGTLVTSLGFGDSIQRIRGPEGSAVRLTVRRGAAVFDVAVPRRRIRA